MAVHIERTKATQYSKKVQTKMTHACITHRISAFILFEQQRHEFSLRSTSHTSKLNQCCSPPDLHSLTWRSSALGDNFLLAFLIHIWYRLTSYMLHGYFGPRRSLTTRKISTCIKTSLLFCPGQFSARSSVR